MLKRLSGATIWSEDLHNLLPFYRDLLGLPVAYEQPGFVGFGERADDAGYVGAYLGLGTHSEVKGKPSDPYRHMVGLDSDDVDADFARLEAAGIEFIEPPVDSGGLRIATLKDPEGNIVQLLQRVSQRANEPQSSPQTNRQTT
jgi:predicted enzyme related to lactoylglutathione lyase